VRRAEVMHLNRDCVYPDLGNLFTRVDVTPLVESRLWQVPDEIAAQLAALQGPLPMIATGEHCSKPYRCPFWDRCWAPRPEFHVSTLYYGGAKARQLEASGYVTLGEV